MLRKYVIKYFLKMEMEILELENWECNNNMVNSNLRSDSLGKEFRVGVVQVQESPGGQQVEQYQLHKLQYNWCHNRQHVTIKDTYIWL